MADTYKVLGQSAPGAASLTIVYTVPALTSSVVSTITIANRSATPTAYRIAIRPAGAAIVNQHYIAFDIAIAGNETQTMTLGVTLAATDVVSVYNVLATLSFNVFGVERT